MKLKKLQDGNWGLKLLALILALAIYHTLKNETVHSQKSNDRSIYQTR